jgi:hypothetical protein
MVLGISTALAAAQFQGQRELTETEQRVAMAALLAQPTMPMSEDPSCKSDLQQPGRVSIAQALGDVLVRAAAESRAVTVKIDCFVRPGYPLAAGQEYCRLGLVDSGNAKDSGFGLAFLMDWKQRSIVPESVECY